MLSDCMIFPEAVKSTCDEDGAFGDPERCLVADLMGRKNELLVIGGCPS